MPDWYRNIRKGAQGELLAAVDLMDRGYEVFRAVDGAASTDLVAHYKGQYWRVQVKTSEAGLAQVKNGQQEVVAWVVVDTRKVFYTPDLPLRVKALPNPEVEVNYFANDADCDRHLREIVRDSIVCI